MPKPYSLSLHIFRRDLRLPDNSALINALQDSERVLPCFIFDTRQIEHNVYSSDNCIEFMLNSLAELKNNLNEIGARLYFFYGKAEEVVEKLLIENPIEAVFINRDYTPFSQMRDHKIEKICSQKDVAFHCIADALLHEPEEVLKPNHEPYHIFTPFMKKALTLSIRTPQRNAYKNYFTGEIKQEDKNIFAKLSQRKNSNLFLKGGRTEAHSLLKRIISLDDYQSTRNFPALNQTSHLSAHNKFGTISIREFYTTIEKYLGKNHTLMSELYWRDFFTHIAFHYPRVFGHAFNEKYDQINWSRNEKHFRAWCQGTTGFPIVDAGMRELNITGYMHNRVRMIVASFLTKDLHIDWRWGEKYFAQKLIDYDPSVNNGNWQWAASTGCDAQPYFRIFNPWLQQLKFDQDCTYIKRWVPELMTVDNKLIHTLNKSYHQLMTNYSQPVIDHNEESKKAKLMYKLLN